MGAINRKLILPVTLLFLSTLIFGQNNKDIDPYYNGHLSESYNPLQADFSSEYLRLRLKAYNHLPNKIEHVLKSDFSPVWPTGKLEQNGVIDLNYQRIRIHIGKVLKGVDPHIYVVEGKSNVKGNICDFKGEIKLSHVFLFDSCDGSDYKNCGVLFTNYTFYEDSSQYHSGVFSGVTECSIYWDKATNTMKLDESYNIADGYWNRSFVGTWKDYKTLKTKKCIWGDYRLPFTFDFDCGDGEMHVNDKYKNNGWQTFGDGSEYISLGNDQFELKEKWWSKSK